MAVRRGNKRTYVQISSSSSEEEEEEEAEEEEDQSVSESESESEEYDGNDDDECDKISASTSCDDDDDDDDDGDEDGSGSDDEDDKSDDEKDQESADHDNNDESRCNRIIRLLRGRSELEELNLTDCRAYLRKHGLRITGTKAECRQRIMEHWRIKDGNAEALYPRSSFTINCTGDVCKGDTVLFTQKVDKKKRTVAGRIVKESYGAARQQHTFTVEVLWSKGIKKLPPLFTLLVKGRNLYKLKTFRQHWTNEKERHKVLAEKHKRGAAARRLVRAKMKAKKALAFPKNGGVKRQRPFHPEGKNAQLEKGKRAKTCGKAPMEHAKSGSYCRKAPAVARASLKNSYPSAPESSRNHQSLPHHNQYWTRTYTFPQSFHQPPMPYHHHQWVSRLQFLPATGSTSSRMGFPHFRPFGFSSVMPSSQHQGSNHGFYPHHAYSHPSRVLEPSNLNPSLELMNIYGLSKTYSYGQRRQGL